MCGRDGATGSEEAELTKRLDAEEAATLEFLEVASQKFTPNDRRRMTFRETDYTRLTGHKFEE